MVARFVARRLNPLIATSRPPSCTPPSPGWCRAYLFRDGFGPVRDPCRPRSDAHTPDPRLSLLARGHGVGARRYTYFTSTTRGVFQTADSRWRQQAPEANRTAVTESMSLTLQCLGSWRGVVVIILIQFAVTGGGSRATAAHASIYSLGAVYIKHQQPTYDPAAWR